MAVRCAYPPCQRPAPNRWFCVQHWRTLNYQSQMRVLHNEPKDDLSPQANVSFAAALHDAVDELRRKEVLDKGRDTVVSWQ